jgi:hypothetical protein
MSYVPIYIFKYPDEMDRFPFEIEELHDDGSFDFDYDEDILEEKMLEYFDEMSENLALIDGRLLELAKALDI